MDNGPKPTHLWHWTGRKHYDRTISDRVDALKWLHPIGGRSRRDTAQMLFFTVTLGLAGAYAMGIFNPAQFTNPTTEVNVQPDCTTKTGVKCPHSKPPGLAPCPCKEDEQCPMEWMKEEERNKKR